LVLAIAGVFIIVFQWAAGRPLWLDEEMIALNLRDRGFGNLHGGQWLDQSAPLGWMWLQRLVLVTFGSAELALRAVPMVSGVGTVVVALFIANRFLSVTGATVLVALCAFGQWISFHAGELKPYSADTFFALLLPLLTVSAASATSDTATRRSLLLWGAIAALGHWFALGALFVLPACSLVLAVSLRRNRTAIWLLAIALLVVGASVAAHYVLNLQYSRADVSLQEYWSFAFPPQSGVSDTLRWLYGRLEPFASKPGGTRYAIAFWISVVAGLALARNRMFAAVMGAVALSGFVFVAVRLVPLYERISLWMVPALYFAIALAADAAVRLFTDKPWRPRWVNSAVTAALGAMVLSVSIDSIQAGLHDVAVTRAAAGNHETDDRSAIAWLIAQRRPGDVVLTTRHALPAVWWYGGVSLIPNGGRSFSDGGRIFTAEYYESADRCGDREPHYRLTGKQRILVYLGFEDMPAGSEDLLLDKLGKLGGIVAVREFFGNSRVAVIDPALTEETGKFWSDADKDGISLKGCVAIRQGRAW
jgi:hypothetical protein